MIIKLFSAFGLWLLASLMVVRAQQTSTQIELMGLVERPLIITLDSLKSLPLQTGGPINIVSTSGQVRKTFQSYRGVLLRDLLDKAHIQMPNQKDKGKYYVVTRATDGYTAVFAHNELFNNPTGKQVLILFEENGKPIAEDGAFVLLTGDDTITGARHVKWLNRIEVRKVE